MESRSPLSQETSPEELESPILLETPELEGQRCFLTEPFLGGEFKQRLRADDCALLCVLLALGCGGWVFFSFCL